MKTLDRYIVRSFLYSMLMWLVVTMSLRIVMDLFINMDEFAEQSEGFVKVFGHIMTYYSSQSSVYFAQLGGVIIVASAAFTVARMNYTNELTAMMASGVSLRRVLLPIVFCALGMSMFVVFDREVIVPRLAPLLVRDRDDVPGTEQFSIRLMTDGNKSVWYAHWFKPAEKKMFRLIIIVRDGYRTLGKISGTEARPGKMDGQSGWIITGANGGAVLSRLAQADQPWLKPPNTQTIWTTIAPGDVAYASRHRNPEGDIVVHDHAYGLIVRAKGFRPSRPGQGVGGVLEKPTFTFSVGSRMMGRFHAESAEFLKDSHSGNNYWRLKGGKLFYPSDLTVKDIKLRQGGRWLEFMSIRQLNNLLELERVPDPKSAIMTKHLRITEPLNNLVMLLVGIPFILSRQRNIKTSALRCLLMVGLFYAFIYISRHLGFGPIWSAWLPVLVFGPIAAIMIDSIKT